MKFNEKCMSGAYTMQVTCGYQEVLSSCYGVASFSGVLGGFLLVYRYGVFSCFIICCMKSICLIN